MTVDQLVRRGLQDVIDSYPKASRHGFGLRDGRSLHIAKFDVNQRTVKLGIGPDDSFDDIFAIDFFDVTFDNLDHWSSITARYQEQFGVDAFFRNIAP